MVKGGKVKTGKGGGASVRDARAGVRGWRNWGVGALIVALVVVVFGGVLFVGAASGWFDGSKVVLDTEYLCEEECDGEFLGGETGLTAAEYEELVEAGKSFVLFVDQGGCTTADRLRGYISDYAKERGFRAYRMMFSEMRGTSLHESVKYYPSVVLVSRGSVIGFLRADADEDASTYNDYEVFKEWMGARL